MLLRGYLSGYDGKELTIIAPFAGAQLLERQGITECEVRLLDGLSQIIISDTTGEVRAVRENGGVVFFGWWLYKIHAKQLVHEA